jgi:tRNA (guanine37-N1)-methyltransferase
MSFEMDVVTLFPAFFKSPLRESILRRAQQKGYIKIRIHNLRDYTSDRHKTADDKPFGGGAGMLMKPEPIFECVETIQRSIEGKVGHKGWVILLDPQGKPFTQERAKKLSRKKRLILIAGHYEGVDHRVRDYLVDEEISIGDFITMGGEAPALCLMEAVIRLLPGVLGNRDSLKHESFQAGRLEYPQYTRPRQFRDWKVPDILVSGHHREVEKWREEASRKITREKRPDLLKKKRP